MVGVILNLGFELNGKLEVTYVNEYYTWNLKFKNLLYKILIWMRAFESVVS